MYQKCPNIRIMAIEPVGELSEIVYSSGISEANLLNGDGMNMQSEDISFDMVGAFGMLYHVRSPEKVISEMLQATSKAICVSGCNNFGSGPVLTRIAKQIINSFCLWQAWDWIKTGGKGCTISEEDGLSILILFSTITGKCNLFARDCMS